MTAQAQGGRAEGSPGLGLALSGGAARGIAHLGVLEVLEEEGIPVAAVAGTSSGAVLGALWAAGLPLAEMRRLVLATRWGSLLRPRVPVEGLLSNEGLAEYLRRTLPVRRFSELRRPFAAVAADLLTAERADLVSGELARAVQASCSIPVLFPPVRLGGRLLVDGGLASQVPVRAAREALGASPVVAVNVNWQGLERPRCDNLARVALHLAALWASRNAREEERLADVVVRVSARGIPLHDLSRGEEMIRRGRAAARAAVPAIRAVLG